MSRSFAPKELELLQFGSEPYLIAYRPPTPETVDGWSSRSGMDFITPTPDGEHVLVSPLTPDRTFPRFDDDTVMKVARDAMPGVAIRDAAWLNEYHDYYYKTVSSFDLGLPRMAKTLPVPARPVRRRRADLALPDAVTRADSQSREPRSRESVGYYGLHAFDFAFLYRHRPLWDIVVIALLVGVGVSTVTTLVPAYRRLARHARKVIRPARPRVTASALGASRTPASQPE